MHKKYITSNNNNNSSCENIITTTAPNPPSSGCCASSLLQNFPRPAWMNVICGATCGVIIGVPSMLIYFQAILSNCGLLLAATESECASSNSCHWDSSHDACLGLSSSVCDPSWNLAKCSSKPEFCSFNAARHRCEQSQGYGWNSREVGLVASSYVIGAVLGGLVASAAARHDQPKKLAQFSVVVVIGAVLAWSGWSIFARSSVATAISLAIVGVGFGEFFALCPPSVASVVPANVRAVSGTLFQLSLVFAIAFSALLALILQDSPSVACHALFVCLVVFGVASFYAAEWFFAPIYFSYIRVADDDDEGNVAATTNSGNSPTNNAYDRNSTESLQDLTELNNNNNTVSEKKNSSSSNMIKYCYIFGIFLGASLQGSGISSIMSAAPKIAKSSGVSNPLVGNAILMFWNAVTCLPSIPLGQRFPPFKLYLVGLVGGSCCCLLTAVAMELQNATFALICICGFLLFFESGQGPMFFTMATEIFPPEVRASAASRVNLINFVFNILVNGLYPSLCDALQPEGEQEGVGVKRAFVLFGVIGCGCGLALFLLFPKTHMYLSQK